MEQDWKPIVFSKKPILEKKIVKREKQITNSSVKLNENDEVIQIKTVPLEIAKLIIAARVSKKLTRQQLAQSVNIKEDIIANIENGKAIYDGNLIAKIKKKLLI